MIILSFACKLMLVKKFDMSATKHSIFGELSDTTLPINRHSMQKEARTPGMATNFKTSQSAHSPSEELKCFLLSPVQISHRTPVKPFAHLVPPWHPFDLHS